MVNINKSTTQHQQQRRLISLRKKKLRNEIILPERAPGSWHRNLLRVWNYIRPTNRTIRDRITKNLTVFCASEKFLIAK